MGQLLLFLSGALSTETRKISLCRFRVSLSPACHFYCESFTNHFLLLPRGKIHARRGAVQRHCVAAHLSHPGALVYIFPLPSLISGSPSQKHTPRNFCTPSWHERGPLKATEDGVLCSALVRDGCNNSRETGAVKLRG